MWSNALDNNAVPSSEMECYSSSYGYIAADQQVPGSNPGVPFDPARIKIE